MAQDIVNTVNEFNITVPWGFISAKSWGNPGNSPILCVHGTNDNAGSFDRLIPLLPNYFYYLCIDLPGHGKSSHFPRGMMPSYHDMMYSVKRVIDHIGWKKFIYLGHSLGGIIGLHLRAVYPESFTRLIMLDILDSVNVSPLGYSKWFMTNYDKIIKIETKMKTGLPPPSYTMDELISLFNNNRGIEPEAAKCLLNRCTIPTDDGKFYLSMDQRNKALQRPPIDEKFRIETLTPKYPFPLLIIRANNTKLINRVTDHALFLKELEKNKCFELISVDGTHDVHNNTPEVVAPFINQFLNETRSSL